MANELYTMSYVDVNPETDAADFNITDLDNWTVDSVIASIIRKGAGEVDPTFIAQGQVSPRFTASTPQIKDILDNLGITGIRIDAGTDPGIVAYMKQLEAGGTRKSGANHMSFTIKEGMLLPRSITATDGPTPASVLVECICITDGSNDPVVIASGKSIGVTPAASVGWVVGPANINGSSVEGVQSLTVDFGLIETVRFGDGKVFAQFVAVMGASPRITLLVDKVSYLATLGIEGAAQGGDDCVVSLRKLTEGGTRVAEATSEHITFTMDEGIIQPGPFNAGLDAAGLASIVLIPTFDGANAILVVDTTAAIDSL